MQINEFKYFYPEKPALVHPDQELIDELSKHPAWICEPKFNGRRLQLHRVSNSWDFWGRHNNHLAYEPSPEVLRALDALPLTPGYWLFDGELRHNKVKGIRHKIVIFDLFIMAGKLLVGIPFKHRRGYLETLFHYGEGEDDETVTLSPQFHSEFRGTFQWLITNPEIEGIVMKNLNGRLDLGRKTAAVSAWMKKIRRPNNSYKF